MFETLPETLEMFQQLSPAQIATYYEDLAVRELTAESARTWCEDWSRLEALVTERMTRLMIAQQRDTRDAAIADQLAAYRSVVFSSLGQYSTQLADKLTDSGLIPQGYESVVEALHHRRAAHIPTNAALLEEEYRLLGEQSSILENHGIALDGAMLREKELWARFREMDRPSRESAFRALHIRAAEDHAYLLSLWRDLLKLRRQQAQNAGFESYADYVWRENRRTEFPPKAMLALHDAIAEVVVPAAREVYQRYRARMGVDQLRPYDFTSGWHLRPVDEPPISPFTNGKDLAAKCAALFMRMDKSFGGYFQSLIDADLLDLDPREGKATVGFSGNQLGLAVARQAHIMMNVSGTDRDVRVLLHEAGHALAVSESKNRPFLHIIFGTGGLTEFASVSMELMASEYLPASKGGFYSAADYAQSHRAYMQELLLWAPGLAIDDAFSHWVYSSPDADDPATCDAQWLALHKRFLPEVDWSGDEQFLTRRWLTNPHLWWMPFFAMDYVLALIGAVQLWQIARQDPARAMAQYRAALRSDGNIHQLFAAAGVHFRMDAQILSDCVEKVKPLT